MARKVASKAAKVEDEQLRDYELVLVFSPELAEDALEVAIDKVSKFITERKGVLVTVEQWGKRRLAYPIKHFVEGIYILARFQLSPKLTGELEANLQISEDILRYLLTRPAG